VWCEREATMRKPWPTSGCCVIGVGGGGVGFELVQQVPIYVTKPLSQYLTKLCKIL
jgi:hypothetical protein